MVFKTYYEGVWKLMTMREFGAFFKLGRDKPKLGGVNFLRWSCEGYGCGVGDMDGVAHKNGGKDREGGRYGWDRGIWNIFFEMREGRCLEMEGYYTFYQLWFTLPQQTCKKQIMMSQTYSPLYLSQQRLYGPQWKNGCTYLSHSDSIDCCCKALHLKCCGAPSHTSAKYIWLNCLVYWVLRKCWET